MTTVFWNDLSLVLRDRWALLATLLAPIVFASLIAGARYGGAEKPRLLVPVVDLDGGKAAAMVVELLSEHANPVRMSRARAEFVVGVRNRAPAALVLPAGFSDLQRRGRTAEIEMLTDPAQAQGVRTVKTLLLLMERDAAAREDPLATTMIEMREVNLTGDRIERRSYEQNIPGFGLMFILMAVVVSTATGLHRENSQGIMGRLLIAPAGFSQIVLAKIAVRWLVGFVELLTLLLWGHFVFGISLGPQTLALLAVCALVALSAAGLGLVVAGVAGSREAALPLSLFAVISLSAIGGLWWPLDIEPAWMQALAPLFFTTWAMWALTDLVLRDRGVADMALTLAGLAAHGVALVMGGLMLFRARHSPR